MPAIEYHLEEAEDAISRSWERWGGENHVETGSLCFQAHLLVAEALNKPRTTRRAELINKAEWLLENAWEHHYDIRDSYRKAIAYARLAAL